MSVLALKKEETITEDFDLEKALAGATETEKKSKDSIIQIEASATLMEKTKKYRDIVEHIKSKETEKETLGEEIKLEAGAIRGELCAKQGYISAIKIPTIDHLSIRLSWKNQYTKILKDNIKRIKDLLGARFSKYFKEEITLTVLPSRMNDKDLKEFIRLLGGTAEFGKWVSVKRETVPADNYTTEFFTDAFNDEEREELSGLVSQYKPSITV